MSIKAEEKKEIIIMLFETKLEEIGKAQRLLGSLELSS